MANDYCQTPLSASLVWEGGRSREEDLHLEQGLMLIDDGDCDGGIGDRVGNTLSLDGWVWGMVRFFI